MTAALEHFDPFDRCVWPGCDAHQSEGLFCLAHALEVPDRISRTLAEAVDENDRPKWRAAIEELYRWARS